MDKKDDNTFMQEGKAEPPEEISNQRLEILSRIESGEIDIDQAIKRLGNQEEPADRMDILNQLEQGHIDVEEALHRLEAGSPSTGAPSPSDSLYATPDGTSAPSKWREWWLVILATALAVIAMGGWLGTVGGWWWLCAGPGLVVGFVLLVVALASRNAPWLHLRVDTGQKTWPRHIALSLPLPIRLASWGLKTWGPRIPSLSDTALDELILALENNLSMDTPIFIEVQ